MAIVPCHAPLVLDVAKSALMSYPTFVDNPQQAPKEGNPLYPLPPDYEQLDRESQKAARLNALCYQETPEDLVTAWTFLRHYYLASLPTGMWYRPPLYPSPMARKLL